MKTFLTTAFAILLFTVTCSAQWTGSGTGYAYLSNTGDKVGIGTASGTTPGLKLHILGALGFPVTTGTSQTGVLRLQGTGSNGVLDFSVNAASGAALQVTSQTDLSQAYPLLLNPNGGSVGIGTAPAFASGTGLEIQQAGPVTLRMQNATSNKSMELRQTATYFSLFNIDAQNTVLAENGGNVGIGTAAPANKLHIIDAAGTNTLNLQLSTNVINETIGVAFGTQPGNRTKAAIVGVNTNTGNAGGALAFYTNAGASLTEAMRVTSTGNVGIGTPIPDTRLTVNGTVHSTQVLVESTVPGADYVFEKEYNLPSLADIKAYTDKNHHLPDVPTAAEMKKNGINLGEMNMTLLKKVEELTLYLIEMNKTVKAQQKEIEQLKKGKH